MTVQIDKIAVHVTKDLEDPLRSSWNALAMQEDRVRWLLLQTDWVESTQSHSRRRLAQVAIESKANNDSLL